MEHLVDSHSFHRRSRIHLDRRRIGRLGQDVSSALPQPKSGEAGQYFTAEIGQFVEIVDERNCDPGQPSSGEDQKAAVS